MSGTWEIISQSKTSETQYAIAKYIGTGSLSGSQATANGTAVPAAITLPFDISGYGHGVTISWEQTGTLTVSLDINNDTNNLPPSDELWVETDGSTSTTTGVHYISNSHATKYVRIRIKTNGGGGSLNNIRLMCNS